MKMIFFRFPKPKAARSSRAGRTRFAIKGQDGLLTFFLPSSAAVASRHSPFFGHQLLNRGPRVRIAPGAQVQPIPNVLV